ncbi:hypothetical protein BpHYR1_047694, partial [Brachionus plicatilis]
MDNFNCKTRELDKNDIPRRRLIEQSGCNILAKYYS